MGRAPLALLPSLLFALGLLAWAAPASAQQPLSSFLAAAEDRALDVREARAALRQTQSQVDEARARLLPSFLAQAGYTRNEFEAAFTNPATGASAVIQPYDALSATFQITVPLIDVGAWSGYFQSEAYAEAAGAQLESTDQAVAASVAQLWYQLVAGRALIDAAERTVETLERNREAAAARVEVGVSPQLELSRAEAEVARARFALADAMLQATLAERNLENLTGLTPSAERVPLEDDLAREEPLDTFLGNARALPAVRAARATERAASIAADTAWTALLPVISATARESGSNAVGFTGQNWAYALGVTATWQLDFQRPAQISTRAAAAEIAAVRAERTQQQVETGLFEAWQRVETARQSAAAAHAALEASRRAAEDARARVDAGVGTQLDLIQAERDAFQAETSYIQAIATLRAARLVLRIRAGMEL